MKTITRLGLAGALAGMVAFGGCSTTRAMMGGGNEQTWTMQTSGGGPAVEAKVEVASTQKGNRDLKVEAKHLAPPDATFSGTSAYVVWLKPKAGSPVNIGVLTPDKDLNAQLETKTPFTSFEVLVTAEHTTQPTAPSGREVMSAKVQLAT